MDQSEKYALGRLVPGKLPFELLILDCDGVLVNSEPILCRTYQCMVQACGYSGSEVDFMRRFSGVREEQIITLLERDLNLSLPFNAKDMRNEAFKALEQNLNEESAFVDLVRNMDAKVCVASNSDQKRLNLSVARSGLADRLGKNVFSADHVDHPKPAPDIFIHAANRLCVDAAHCLVIEDSLSGIQAAQAFGARVVAFSYRLLDDTQAQSLLEGGAAELILDPMDILSAG